MQSESGWTNGRLHLQSVQPGPSPSFRVDEALTLSGAKITKPLPVPVGKLGPGVSRLSERNINKIIDPPRSHIVKKSKFFGSKSGEVQEEIIALKWESSDGPSPQPDNIAGPSRSPSPSFSVVSHPKAEAEFEDSLNHLTSPVAPNMSSPAMSSPPDFETLTSPRCQRVQRTRSRSTTGLSPTRSIQPNQNQPIQNILVPSTSQMPNLSPMPQTQTPKHIPITSSSAPVMPDHGLGTSTFSNFASSDSIDIEEVVTPSLPTENPKKRSTTKSSSRDSLGKRLRDEGEEVEEVTIEEQEREEKAKTIAKDWRLKYAFGGVNVSQSAAEGPQCA